MAVLYRQHYDGLLRKARIMLHNEEDARDAVGDVMTRLMQADLLPEGEQLVAYAMGSVGRECLNRLKQMKLQERLRRALPLEDVAEETDDEAEQRYSDYQQFIQTELTPQTRRVFQMHYGDRLKYREIAQLAGISEAAVYKHLSKAIMKLKNRFNP